MTTVKKFTFSFFFFVSLGLSSQPVEKIKFAKTSYNFLFFQKGTKSDTISKNKSELFYFIIPDSLKQDVVISVENGRLQKTGNDSLLRLEYLPGLQYETFFSKIEGLKLGVDQKKSTKKSMIALEIKTLINGVSDKEKNTVTIKISSKKEEKVILENTFYYQK